MSTLTKEIMASDDQKAESSDDHLDEFMEKVSEGQGSARPKKARNHYPESDVAEKEEEKKQDPGKLCQYRYFGTGYMPATATLKKLPPGCYRIEATPAGAYFNPCDVVTDKLLRLPDSVSDDVIEEVEHFWTLKRVFKKYGFTHKRGFLLWGPPGSGKSCTIAIIIEKMVKQGGIVILADSPSYLGHMLSSLRSIEPHRPVVVIWEDLDAVVERYAESEVLAVLDGEAQIDNMVCVATTNYPERLDARIANRPSRFDRIVKIGMPNDASRKMYLESKVGTHISPDGTDLVAITKDFSLAHLRELIIAIWCLKQKPEAVVKRLKGMKCLPKSNGNSQIGFVVN